MNYWNNFIGHLRTILHHKKLVRHYCFKAGLYKQGIMLDWIQIFPNRVYSGSKVLSGWKTKSQLRRENSKGLFLRLASSQGTEPSSF